MAALWFLTLLQDLIILGTKGMIIGSNFAIFGGGALATSVPTLSFKFLENLLWPCCHMDPYVDVKIPSL
jgi:hypothetical protein